MNTNVCTSNNTNVAVVDPYSSGRQLVHELKEQGFCVYAVRSTMDLDHSFMKSWEPEHFAGVFVVGTEAGAMAGVAEELQKLNVVRVLAGSEPGVEACDELNELMGLGQFANLSSTAHLRRNKRAMQEAVKAANLRSTKQCEVDNAQAAIEFATTECNYPLIVKPVASSGSDGVYKVHDEHELVIAVNTVCTGVNTSGKANETALVQEFLAGTEFVVDCVSKNGEHVLCMMWVYQRVQNAGGIAYDRIDAVEAVWEENHFTRRLAEYVFGCLDACGIRNGPSHSEVMWVGGDFLKGEGEPCLIETGARMHGAQGPRLWADAYGRENGQPFLTVDAVVNNGAAHAAKLAKQRAGQAPFDFNNTHCAQVYLISTVAGELELSVTDACPELLSLPSVHVALLQEAQAGCWISPTRDLLTTPGVILMVGPKEQIDADRAQLRKWEAEGSLFQLRRARPHARSSLERVAMAGGVTTDATAAESDSVSGDEVLEGLEEPLLEAVLA